MPLETGVAGAAYPAKTAFNGLKCRLLEKLVLFFR